jgi:hypothetical protein
VIADALEELVRLRMETARIQREHSNFPAALAARSTRTTSSAPLKEMARSCGNSRSGQPDDVPGVAAGVLGGDGGGVLR